MIDSREQVMSRMVDQAARRGANAVIAMPFDTGELAEQMTEVCVYGTAVVVSPIPQGQAGATLQSMDQTRGARR